MQRVQVRRIGARINLEKWGETPREDVTGSESVAHNIAICHDVTVARRQLESRIRPRNLRRFRLLRRCGLRLVAIGQRRWQLG
jgi:hypothetical protein